jgi:lipopolysaccharide assembly outer membrane protein LptD (OstA)
MGRCCCLSGIWAGNGYDNFQEQRILTVKLFALAALVFASVALASQPRTQKPSDSQDGSELKHFAITLPSGEPVRFTAMDISRNWDTSVIHLKGAVKAEIRESVKAGSRYLVIHADEVSYDEKTGELIPSGNVRVAQERVR